MKAILRKTNSMRAAMVLAGTAIAITNLFGQQGGRTPSPQEAAQLARHQANLQQLQQMLTDKSGYADTIVQRW